MVPKAGLEPARARLTGVTSMGLSALLESASFKYGAEGRT